MSIRRNKKKPYRKVCMMQTSCRAFSYILSPFFLSGLCISYSFMFESTKQKGRRSLMLSKQ